MEVNDPGEWMSDGWTSDDNNTTIFDCFTPLHLQLSLHTIFIWRQPKENWIVTGESLIQLTFGYFVMSYLSKCWSVIQKIVHKYSRQLDMCLQKKRQRFGKKYQQDNSDADTGGVDIPEGRSKDFILRIAFS